MNDAWSMDGILLKWTNYLSGWFDIWYYVSLDLLNLRFTLLKYDIVTVTENLFIAIINCLGWQPRYFILEDGILSYYHSKADINNSCKGSIKVSACDIIG